MRPLLATGYAKTCGRSRLLRPLVVPNSDGDYAGMNVVGFNSPSVQSNSKLDTPSTGEDSLPTTLKQEPAIHLQYEAGSRWAQGFRPTRIRHDAQVFSRWDGRVANAWCWEGGLQAMGFGEKRPVVLTVGSSHCADDTPAVAPRVKRPDRSNPPSLK